MNRDPTREEMIKILADEIGLDEFDGFDIEEAIYWFANDYHSGQDSELYRVLSNSRFKPSPLAYGIWGLAAQKFYRILVEEFEKETRFDSQRNNRQRRSRAAPEPRIEAMTEQDRIRTEYTVINGVIRDPGKFEGEAEYGPYFWEAEGEELSVLTDGCGEYAALIEITPEDCAEFPDSFDLRESKYVLVVENDQGCVSIWLIRDEELADKVRKEYEDEDENKEDSL